MSTIKKIVLTVLIYSFTIQNSFCQEIKEDTIYASIGAEISLFFHDKITSFDYTDQAAYAEFIKKQFDDKSVSIKAKVSNAHPAKLQITEGKRNHLFILVYKEKLSNTELDHDWEDLNYLKSYVASLEKKKAKRLDIASASTPNKQQTPSNTTPVDKKEQISPASPSVATPADADSYVTLIEKGIKDFNSKNFANARNYFTKASEKNPSDKLAKDWLLDTENKLFTIEQEKSIALKEQEFAALIKSGDENFKAKNFAIAQQDYLMAKNIKPTDKYLKTRLEETKQKILETSKQTEIKQRDDRYNNNIASGDEAFKEGRFEEARAAFEIATNLKNTEKYPRDKIKQIDDIKAKQDDEKLQLAKETQFRDEMNLGHEAYNAGNREIARAHYEKAIKIRRDTAAEELIKKIDLYKKDSLQTIKKAQLLLAEERANTEKYNAYKDKGDRAFNDRSYETAKNYYNQALAYKQETYAKNRLEETKNKIDEINAINENKKQINSLIIKAKAAFNNNDFNNASSYYSQALKLDPSDVALVAKLNSVNKKLEEIRLEKERNEHYDTALARASRAFADQSYNNAITYYREAVVLKADDPYPAKQITIINGILSETEEKRKQKEIFEQRRQIVGLKDDASKAIIEKRWKDALQNFNDIIKLNPTISDKEYALQKILMIQTEINKMDSLSAKIAPAVALPATKPGKDQRKRDAIFEAQRQKQEKIRLDTIASQVKRLEESKKQSIAPTSVNSLNISTTNNGFANTILQNEAIPYQHDELIKRYPDINFDEIPPGQTYDPTDRKNRGTNYETCKKVLLDSSSLNLSDSTNYVKAICKSIAFNGNNAFIKISIKNAGSTDYLTGQIQLKVIRKNKTSLNLNQRYISDFPIVLPHKEFSVVYVSDASVAIDATDTLIMEIDDRFKKTKLKIMISGVIYNMRKMVKL